MIVGISGYIGERKTGIGRNLENVLVRMAKANQSDIFYLFTNFDQHDYRTVDWPENVRPIYYKVSCKSPILNILWHQFFFQYNLKKLRCDCCLIPNFSLLLWKVVPTTVVISDLIEFIIPAKFSKLRVLYRRVIVPLMARNSERIITISQSSKDDIVKFTHVDARKIAIALCSHDANFFNQKKKQEVETLLNEYSLVPNSYLLYVGTVDHPGKNLFSLLEAYLELKEEKKIDKKLVIIGNPGHQYEFIHQTIMNCKHKEDIKILGFIEDAKLPFFYAGASLFCFLSLYEGFGLPVLEAMACGCPVMSSSRSSMPEVAGDAAMFVDPMNIKMIKEVVARIVTTPELQEKLIEKGLSRAKQFDWSISANIYYDVLKSTIDSSDRRDLNHNREIG